IRAARVVDVLVNIDHRLRLVALGQSDGAYGGRGSKKKLSAGERAHGDQHDRYRVRKHASSTHKRAIERERRLCASQFTPTKRFAPPNSISETPPSCSPAVSHF